MESYFITCNTKKKKKNVVSMTNKLKENQCNCRRDMIAITKTSNNISL